MVSFSNPNAENTACNARKYDIGSKTVSDVCSSSTCQSACGNLCIFNPGQHVALGFLTEISYLKKVPGGLFTFTRRPTAPGCLFKSFLNRTRGRGSETRGHVTGSCSRNVHLSPQTKQFFGDVCISCSHNAPIEGQNS